jgi:hypothetical protein
VKGRTYQYYIVQSLLHRPIAKVLFKNKNIILKKISKSQWIRAGQSLRQGILSGQQQLP